MAKRNISHEPIIANKESLFQNKEEGKPANESVVSNIADTPETRKVEEYLGHMAAIIESSEDAIISKSLDGIIKSWNKGAEKMFGYTAIQVIDKHISLIIPPDYINEEKDILDRIRNGEIIEHYETVRIKRNGRQFYVSLTVSPIKNQAGQIIGISKIIRDISVRKKSEAALIHARKELAFQNEEKGKLAAELIIANKELVFQNEEKEKRATELIIANKELAFQNREKESRAAELIIANQELAFQNEEKENRAGELIIANKELAFQNNEKEKRSEELIIANKELIFQNEEKEKRAAELIATNRDIKKGEERLIEANKELESFSYSVSHDLRAPLRAIHGYTKLLKGRYETKLDSEGNRLMNNIVDNAKRMGQLIDDLLLFSRLGRNELVKMNIPMHELVTNLCNELKNEQADRNIEFQINHLLPAKADNTAIKQVWLNLISNAVKYSRQKEKAIIEIGSEIKGDEIVYHIKDNGAGFDMRYADKLFGVFQRLHSDDEFEGTGVGLALVQRIIFKHEGRVWGEGKVNGGAIFHFTLPKT